jgi:sortase A
VKRAAALGVAALIAAGCANAAILLDVRGASHARATVTTVALPTTTSPTMTTTTIAPTTTTTVPDLPTPQHSPADPYAAVPVRQIGTIEIPRIGLVHPIFEGIWLTVIDHGPGHWPGTAMPGQRGNVVFAGHRVTHTHPFRRLDELRPGDHIVFHMPNGTFTYAVTDTIIVLPTDSWVVNQHNAFDVTLIACHPPHSATERIVVQGRLISKEGAT